MEFVFTDEQKMIIDTAEAFLAEVSTSESIRQVMEGEDHFNAELWQRVCSEMYWQAMHIPEEYGGMGLGYVEVAAVMEQMGKYLLVSPFFATVCQAVNAVLLGGNEDQKAQYLSEIAEGSTATLAYNGGGLSWGASSVTATAKAEGDNYTLNGEYRYVLDVTTADFVVVAAREAASQGNEGISLFVLPSDTAGLDSTWNATLDQTRALGTLSLNNVCVSSSQLLGEPGQGWPTLEKTLAMAQIALSAEQAGGTQALLDMTVAYTQERVQFGRTIASFQSTKHKAADMMVRAEVAKSGVYYAACVADEALQGGELADELVEAGSVTKAYSSEAYFENAGQAMQLHGGVGFTWEYDVHLHFKRAKASELYLGNADEHYESLADTLLGGAS